VWQVVCCLLTVLGSSSSSSSSSSRNEYYLGGIIALLLQDHRAMSTKSVCSNQYMVTGQHWATGAQINHSILSDRIRNDNRNRTVFLVGRREEKARSKHVAVEDFQARDSWVPALSRHSAIYRVAQKSKLLYCDNSLLFLSHPVVYVHLRRLLKVHS